LAVDFFHIAVDELISETLRGLRARCGSFSVSVDLGSVYADISGSLFTFGYDVGANSF